MEAEAPQIGQDQKGSSRILMSSISGGKAYLSIKFTKENSIYQRVNELVPHCQSYLGLL